MRVLVTGGAGFIGSHLVARLLAGGVGVTVLDDLSTGKLDNLPRSGDVELVTGDIADPAAVARALVGVQAVVHLAAVASVEASVRDPLGTSRTNHTGSLTVFQGAASAGVARLLYASSAAVYGDPEVVPLPEDARLRPLSPYAADKLAGEHHLANFHRSGALFGCAFRFFNVYGPRQDPASPYSGVISVFLDRASRGLPLRVHGDGLQTRDFVYVADVVEVLWRALGSGEAAQTSPTWATAELPRFNVGRGEAVTLLELIAAIGQVVAEAVGGTAPSVTFGPPRAGDIRHSTADVARLAEAFGVPSTALAAGLAATLPAAAGEPSDPPGSQ